jgi:tetratricopeptide (TPR) repeat protein
VDAILAGQEMRSIPLVALEDGGAAARTVFDARKKKYAAHAGWMRLREYDLSKMIFLLLEKKRAPDALELAKILVELYPNSAMAWSRLGSTQIAAGSKPEGLASYRRALALAPDNLDHLDQEAALAAN